MSSLLLDTHAWIWFANGDENLKKSIRNKIEDAIQQNSIYIAAISLWEIGMLDAKKRIIIGMPSLEWVNKSVELMHLQILPITPSIAIESCMLPGSFHGDPADGLIVATARVEGATLVSRDKNIIEYSKSKYVSVLQI